MTPFMKKIYFLFLIAFSLHSFGQTLEGSVFDENKNPVMGVSIYLDGTTIETSTDENGKYILNLKEKITIESVHCANDYTNYFKYFLH